MEWQRELISASVFHNILISSLGVC